MAPTGPSCDWMPETTTDQTTTVLFELAPNTWYTLRVRALANGEKSGWIATSRSLRRADASGRPHRHRRRQTGARQGELRARYVPARPERSARYGGDPVAGDPGSGQLDLVRRSERQATLPAEAGQQGFAAGDAVQQALGAAGQRGDASQLRTSVAFSLADATNPWPGHLGSATSSWSSTGATTACTNSSSTSASTPTASPSTR